MILVAGSANLDFVVRAAHIPAPGETVLGRDFQTFAGGKGANQAVACARAGAAETAMVLALGDDVHATVLEQSLHDAGVRVHVRRAPELPTGTAFICVSDAAQNAITVAPGANLALQRRDLPPLDGVSHLLLQLETPLETVIDFAAAAKEACVQVVLNAAPARPLPQSLLDRVDVLIVNEQELALVTGISDDIDRALTALAVPTVVVTLGEHGCRARNADGQHSQAAFAVQAVDTTAAGDTFCGALVAALAGGVELPLALRQASAAAALACTRAGAQDSIPTHAQVTAFLLTHTAAP